MPRSDGELQPVLLHFEQPFGRQADAVDQREQMIVEVVESRIGFAPKLFLRDNVASAHMDVAKNLKIHFTLGRHQTDHIAVGRVSDKLLADIAEDNRSVCSIVMR